MEIYTYTLYIKHSRMMKQTDEYSINENSKYVQWRGTTQWKYNEITHRVTERFTYRG